MNFQFFESLSRQEADSYLTEYLAIGRRWMTATYPALGVSAPTVELLIDAFGSLAASARLEPLDASGGVGAVEFDGDSRVEIVKVSYLLGEVVRGESPSTLHWGLGEANTAVQMQPVIRGFAHGLELSTMLVTSNLTRRMVDGQRVDEVVGATLHTWSSKIEGPR